MAHFKTPFSIQCTCGKIYSKNTQFDAGYSGNYIRIICRSCDAPIVFEAFDDFSRYDVMVGGAIRMSDLNWYHRALMKLQEEDADDKAAEVSKNAAKSIVDLQSAEESESSKEGDVEESAVEDEHDKQCKALVSSDQAAGVARTAAKSIADLQSAEESESSKEGDVEESAVEDEHDKQRKAAVHKLEKASEDTILGQIFFHMAHFKIPFSIQCSCGKIYSKNSQFNAGYSGNYIRIICGSCDSPIVFEAYDDFSRYDVMVGGAIRMSDLNWYHRALFKLQEEDADDKAAEVSKNAAKSIADLQSAEESESSKEGDVEESAVEEEDEDEHDKQRKAALDKLEKASEDTILGQGLKALDTSVENFASGAWQALGSAWRGSSNLVHKLEDSAVNLAESIQQGAIPAPGSLAPSIIESGKAFTAKGMQVLELVGKETMDLLITETGIQVQGNMKEGQPQDHEDQMFEEVTFDRCFYIYGGPEQLEELEALANHYTLLFNRRKTKLSSEQKSFYEGKLKQVQQIFSFSSEIDGSATESEKGKKIETGAEDGADEMKILHDSSVSKAAEMAAGFANALAGIAANDIIQKTAGRLDSLHSEGVHRLSEICCSAVSQLLMLAKSVISNANKAQDEDVDEDMLHMDWPEDSIEKAKIIRTRAQSMTGNVEAVCNSFITGIADVAEAYAAAIKGATADSQEVLPQKSIQEKANSFSENLHFDQTTAVGKIQDGLQYLTYVVLSTSMPVA